MNSARTAALDALVQPLYFGLIAVTHHHFNELNFAAMSGTFNLISIARQIDAAPQSEAIAQLDQAMDLLQLIADRADTDGWDLSEEEQVCLINGVIASDVLIYTLNTDAIRKAIHVSLH